MALSTSDFKVADIELAGFGRKEITLAEHEMPGLMALRGKYADEQPLAGARIAGSLHMTVQTAVLIETLVELGADVRWVSCNIFSTQDHAAAAVAVGPNGTMDAPSGTPVFAWKGETLEEYWWATEQLFRWPDGGGPNLILDDGGDATMLVHKGLEFEKAGSVPEADEDDPEEWGVFLERCRTILADDPSFFSAIAPGIKGVSEETTTGVHRLYERCEANTLLFPAINVNDAVTKSKFDNLYGCRHSLTDGIMRATDVMLSGKKVVICGFGDVGKGSAASMAAQAAVVYITEIDPICALQACMEGYQVDTMENCISKHKADVFITTTGNKDIITLEHMSKMKNNAIVGNIGHFDNEIDTKYMRENWVWEEVKPQVHKIYRDDGQDKDNYLIILSEGRLINLGNATGHPSRIMDGSFANQVLAQMFLYDRRFADLDDSAKQNAISVTVLPKQLDEEVAALMVAGFGGVMTELTSTQADYINVSVAGPFKNDSYKY